MDAKLTINGNPTKSQSFANLIASVLATQNPASDTAVNALAQLPDANAAIKAIATAGKPADLFVIFADDKPVVQTTREKLVKRMTVTNSVNEWQCEYVGKPERKSKIADELVFE